MTTPAFITTIYGEKYAPFLLPHLHSIAQHHPGATGAVLWQNLPQREIDLCAAAYPTWPFIKTDLPVSGDIHQRIPRKLHAWRDAAALFADQPLCFLDCDTLLYSPLTRFLEGTWDITFTWKDEVFPINTGVILVKSSDAATVLFTELVSRVEYIIRNEARLAAALGASGAADQHALRELVGFCNYDRDIPRTISGRELIFRGIPCRQLNETNCRPLTPPPQDLAIIHYKTGWHPILLDDADFTQNRPADRCKDMFQHFKQSQRTAGRDLAHRLITGAASRHLESFAPIADGYEERGILNSEMLAVCTLCRHLNIEVIIESGRARGQSTYMLARYFQNSPVRIASIELERDADAIFAEERLAPFQHVELLYGDAFKVLPALLGTLKGKRIALLLDGPKGLPAINLLRTAFAQSADIRAGFIHDTRRETPQRDLLNDTADRIFFTDDADYVREFQQLDRTCLPADGEPITMHTWRPNMKGEDPIASYGPTLAILFPDAAPKAPAQKTKPGAQVEHSSPTPHITPA